MQSFLEWSSLMAVFFGGFGFILNEMRRMESKIDSQSARTDRLYEMFIDLIKEGRK